MAPRLVIAAALFLTLAACRSTPYETSGSSYPPAPAYGSPAAEQKAIQGCASGQQADFLHQDRPGGSDYDPARCRRLGY